MPNWFDATHVPFWFDATHTVAVPNWFDATHTAAVPTWFDATHTAGSIAKAFLLLTLTIFVRRTFPQALLFL